MAEQHFLSQPKQNLPSAQDEIVSEGITAVKLPLVDAAVLPSVDSMIDRSHAETLLLVQLPSSLPIVYPNDSASLDYNPLFGAADGLIGKIRMHRSGKVTAKIGKVVFDVETGIAPSCAQMICIRKDNNSVESAPLPGKKIKLTIDIDRIQDAIEKEASK
jgi:hypothetical protein